MKYSVLFAAVIGLLLTACSNEEWDRHYNNTDVVLSDKSLADCIKDQAELSTFYHMIEIAGYEELLNSPQSLTVWAPTNSALASLNPATMDSTTVRELVENHISRFSYITTGLQREKIFLLSNKALWFAQNGSDFQFGTGTLVDKNQVARNGILHTINQYQPYNPNLWELLNRMDGIDSLQAYINSLIVTDEFDNTVNYLLENYASLDDEDSTYTVVIPDDAAWTKAFQSSLSYHTLYYKDGENVSLKKTGPNLSPQYAKAALINHLFFSKVSDPYAFDSIMSTNKAWFNVANLFQGANKYTASNGVLYKTDSLRMAPHESWQRPIVVEAEEPRFGRNNINNNLYFRSSEGTGYETSGDKYIVMEPTVTGGVSKVSVIFPIPNVLSATYDIYCVFVPERIANSVDPKPNKIDVGITFRKATGIYQPTTFTPVVKGIVTSADSITKVRLGRATFPWATPYDGTTNSVEVKLRIDNAVSSSQTTTMSRTMRIDCVIFEPVVN